MVKEYIELLMIVRSPGIVEQKGCVKGANIEICSLNKPDSVCIYLLMTGSYDEVTTAPVKKLKRHWRKYAKRIHRTGRVDSRI